MLPAARDGNDRMIWSSSGLSADMDILILRQTQRPLIVEADLRSVMSVSVYPGAQSARLGPTIV